MTVQEIQLIAASEFEADGMLSKGTRIAIIEKARAGERFEVCGNTYDQIRIGAALRKAGEHKLMQAKTIDKGRKIMLLFN